MAAPESRAVGSESRQAALEPEAAADGQMVGAEPPVAASESRAAGAERSPAAPEPRRVGTIGAGAMGSLYGGLLADAGVESWLVGRSAAHAAAIESRGLLFTHAGEERLTRPRATTDAAAVGEVDLLMVWVKSQHTAEALAAAAPMVGPRTLVASFQNGLGNAERIAAAVGPERVVYGVSTIGGVTEGPGRIELTDATWEGGGKTWMGVLEGDAGERLEPLRALFERAGIHAEVRADVDVVVWTKLAMAAPMNSLAALTRLDMGGVTDDEGLAGLRRRMAAEIVAVGRARGVDLDLDEVLHAGEDTYAAARGHLPSMLQDVLAGRPTEIDAMAGEVVRQGERLHVATPVTELVWRLVAAADHPEPARAAGPA